MLAALGPSVVKNWATLTLDQFRLTEYWAHRVTYCVAPSNYPRVFCWVYKHEGKRMKPELRCHAVLCRKPAEPALITTSLTDSLHAALMVSG